MSLPTKEDLKLDRILQHMDKLDPVIEVKLQNVAVDWLWETALHNVPQFMVQIDDYINRKSLHKVNSREVLLWMQALDHLLLDEYMFTSSLGIDVIWDVNIVANMRGQQALGCFTFQGDRTIVRLDPSRHRNSSELIGTILHEMVHALISQLARYEGVLVETATNKKLVDVFRKLQGASGHAYYFQKVARVVEDRARQLLDSRDIKLYRLDSLMVEYKTTGQIPTGAYFEELFKAPKYADQIQPEPARDWIVRYDERERLKNAATRAKANNQRHR